MSINLDDTRRCPSTSTCETCSTAREGLAVVTVDTSVGVFCMTTCRACNEGQEDGEVGRFPLVTATLRVLEHCEHLGIDVDQMAAARRSD